jgi:hypothetical protein
MKVSKCLMSINATNERSELNGFLWVDNHTKSLNLMESNSDINNILRMIRGGRASVLQHLDIGEAREQIEIRDMARREILTHNCVSASSMDRNILAILSVEA